VQLTSILLAIAIAALITLLISRAIQKKLDEISKKNSNYLGLVEVGWTKLVN
jgi:hypothetical protein